MDDVLIIGGGFFGMYLAGHFAQKGRSVLLVDKEADFMQRASYANQARVHNGYHYPRSVLTALRSRVSYPRFCSEFKECINDEFEKYYLVGKILSKVSAKQFEQFCLRIGARCEPAPPRITRWLNPALIEAAYAAVECAFDAVKLKGQMKRRIEDAGVRYRLGTMVRSVRQASGALEVVMHPVDRPDDLETHAAAQVFNCTYSMLNFVTTQSGLEPVPLKHEMTEMCLVEVPEELRDKGVTVMCGPFFSVMPFPPRGLHSFSHVRYTPHYEWHDRAGGPYVNAHEHFARVEKQTAWRRMLLDSRRYLPLLDGCVYRDSIWEVKTVLPRSEVDDSRPILFKPNYGFKGFHCVIGGKLDNVYDAVDVITSMGLNS